MIPAYGEDTKVNKLDCQKERDEVYEKCLRKVQQALDFCNRAGNHGQARVVRTLMLAIKSLRHSEHEAACRVQQSP